MNDELERRAVLAMKKYKGTIAFFAPELLGLLSEIADRLGWQNLKGELK